VGDRWGRKEAVLICYCGVFAFGLLSAGAVGYYSMALPRFGVGVAFGIGVPCWNALSSELSPSYWRILINTVSGLMFPLGEMFSVLLLWTVDPTLQDLPWRQLLVVSSLPALAFLIGAVFLLDPSPMLLATKGRDEEARDVLRAMAKSNGAEHVDVRFRPVSRQSPAESSLWQALRIFNSELCFSTAVVAYACGVLNFIYYGCCYAFPLILHELNFGSSPAAELFFGCVWEVIGGLLAVFVGMGMKRKSAMKFFASLSTLSFVVFAFFVNDTGDFGKLMVQMTYYFIKCFPCLGFSIFYQYAAEIYPTEIRAMGGAFCIAVGRIGAISSTLIYAIIAEQFHFVYFFILCGLLCFVTLLLIPFLPFETANKSLDDNYGSVSIH